MPLTQQDLVTRLHRIDGRGYPAYKDLRGVYDFDALTLLIDHVQGDPFAAPSRVRVRVPMALARLPQDALSPGIRQVALRDYLSRAFSFNCGDAMAKTGSGKSGLIAMPMPGQEILERGSVVVNTEFVEARFVVGLPARGRRILGREAATLLCERIPRLARDSLLIDGLRPDQLAGHLDTAEDAEALRQAIADQGLVAFVADGAILPRRSGIDDRPMAPDAARPFESPSSLRVTVDLPHAGQVTGMGIRHGITLIVGGGYHGKSTLLTALERGVYNHVPGDGRERVVCDAQAVKIRAEDGRRVERVDVRPFINNLPVDAAPAAFCTENASGSTSQAANIMEALEIGARTLLLDEDTCATNLMIRDARMQALIEKEGEPITPFLDRARQLADDRGVSSILVFGGAGDYFDIADTVIRMHRFEPADVTEEARAVAAQFPSARRPEAGTAWPGPSAPRHPEARSLDARKGRREVNIKARALRSVTYGVEEIDVSQLAQLVDEGQVRAIGQAIHFARQHFMASEGLDMATIASRVMATLATDGLDKLAGRPAGDCVEFRAHEFAAAVNRLRTLRITPRQ